MLAEWGSRQSSIRQAIHLGPLAEELAAGLEGKQSLFDRCFVFLLQNLIKALGHRFVSVHHCLDH